MTATPTIDQILANLAELNRSAGVWELMPDEDRDDVATFVQRLTDSLPDVAPATVGRALVHVADIYGMYATCDNKQPLSDEAFAAVWMLGEVGRRLYFGDQQGQHEAGQ